MNPDSAVVAESVRAEMARRQVTPQELAPLVGMSKSTFRRRYRGDQPWRADELMRIARVLNVSATRFIVDGENGSAA